MSAGGNGAGVEGAGDLVMLCAGLGGRACGREDSRVAS